MGQSVTNAAGEVAVEMGAGTGVVGPGTLEVTGGTLAAETHRQNAGRNGVDPQTGQPYVMVPLSQSGFAGTRVASGSGSPTSDPTSWTRPGRSSPSIPGRPIPPDDEGESSSPPASRTHPAAAYRDRVPTPEEP